MKLVELKCKNCGAVLKVEPDAIDIHCSHCKTNYKLDDEARHIKYDDMEKAGYDYEKGRIRAKKEHEEEIRQKAIEARQAAAKAERDAKNRKWKIIGLVLLWIYFLPFMATYYIWKKTSLNKKAKIGIIVAIWVFFIVVAVIGFMSNKDAAKVSSTDETTQTNSLATYYQDDELINLYINRFNEANPDYQISSSELKKYHHHGRDHDDQVKFTKDGFEILISHNFELQVFIDDKSDTYSEEEYKKMFLRFGKAFNLELTNEQLTNYWEQVLSSSTDSISFDDFKCEKRLTGDNRLYYIQINGKLE